MEALKSQDLTKVRPESLRAVLGPFKPAAESLPPYSSALEADTVFQIVEVRDTTKSNIAYIERLVELIDANEGFYDRQNRSKPTRQKVIRSADVNGDAHEHLPPPVYSSMYRLTLQDAHGNLCYAYEIEPLPFLRATADLYPIKLGSKLLVYKGTTVMLNATLHLGANTCRFLGGELPHMNYKLYQRELEKFKHQIDYIA
ncbi:hypothetical protein OGAPHI_003208 [Ogataea philodendri]|uniref:RecQ mediated genome instability protein 1 OB-fold domain-containing protein n=1 Tax=Ogataea philodendri TaxID=1378263 RepID=A0A9P8P884_9ASCO|nr:uncharacterized protein OGAPHI_003208 [Ogataea philodendri]KAH3666759.1 hypothetical protein OGAPHI_003208 [Ogataea philodendri]